MPLFGTDGDGTAGIATPTPGTPVAHAEAGVSQNVIVFCGGVAAEAGTPTHVSIRFDAALVDPMDCYAAVYKGGTDLGSGNWSPAGATLIGQTANLTYSTSGGAAWQQDIALTGGAAFANGDRVWFALVNRKASGEFYTELQYIDPTVSPRGGDWTQKTGSGSFDYGWFFSGVSGTTPPSTAPSGGAVTIASPFVAYITYSSGGGSAASRSRRRKAFFQSLLNH